MSSRSYSVETRGQAALVLGGPTTLTTGLTTELKSRGLHTIKFTTPEELAHLHETHDLDYLFVFLDSPTLVWLAGEGRETTSDLQASIQSGETRLITAHHLSFTPTNFHLGPVYKNLIFVDYLGESSLVSPVLETWFESVRTSRSLVIPGDGLAEVSLLSESDLIRGLALATLLPTSRPGQDVLLGNPDPISLLNLAYEIRSALPFKVDLTFDSNVETPVQLFDPAVFANTCHDLSWELKGNLNNLLQTYLAHSLPTEPTVSPVRNLVETSVSNFVLPLTPAPPAKPHKLSPLRQLSPVFVPLRPHRDRSPHRLVKQPLRLGGIVGRGLVIAFALYLGSLAFSATISGLYLRNIFFTLKSGTIPVSNRLASATTTYLEANFVAISSIPGLNQSQLMLSATNLLDAYSQALVAFSTATDLDKSTADIMHYVFGSGTADIAKALSLSRLQIEELSQELSLLSGSLPGYSPAIIPARYAAAYQEGKSRLEKLQHSVVMTRSLLSTAPDLIGLGGRKKYGVLFQNNMELRATGGFIGSFAILSFENGKLYDMPIYDVYAADGQLKGHVEPPKPIKDVLGEANWYLRDSNFDPDFPTSARRAEWFIKKTLNLDLDGTIGIDVNTLSSLLRATGPLTIPDYNETINADNLYERTQFHAEVNFFPGSTQKKEFLSTVGNALFAGLPSLGTGQGLKLATALSDTLTSKDTLVSLDNPNSERVFSTLNWNGQVNDLPCPAPTECQKDYLMVVDSNFGVNKANYFIKRAIEEVVTLNKDFSADHVLRLHYTNTSASSSWPAGAYKNYSRLYLPPDVKLNSLKVGDKILDPKDYTLSAEHNKTVVGYLVNVPIASNLDVEVAYQLPAMSPATNPTYTWYWQKQPGTSSQDPLVVYVNYPLFLRPQVISPQATLSPQQLKFNLINDADHRVTVKFTQ